MLVIIILLLNFCEIYAKYSVGIIDTNENWAYLDRFCFVSEVGKLTFTLSYPINYEIETLYLYYDTKDQWEAAYNGSLTCQQREAVLSPDQMLPLSKFAFFGAGDFCSTFEDELTNETWSMRPRWWYLAIGNCDSTKGLYMEYELIMANANITNRWFYQFSFDEFCNFSFLAIYKNLDILPISVFFILVEVLLLVVTVVFTFILKAKALLHTTYKIFLYSLGFDFIGLACIWLHYDRYSDNGIGFPRLKTIGVMARHFSIVLFVFLLLLVGKGYTITRAKLSAHGTIRLLSFTILFLILHVLMMIWELTVFDPAKVTYASESAPAYVIAGLRIVAWAWYCRAAYITVLKYPSKRLFYLVLSILMTLWFWAGPITLIFANFVLDNWVRAEVVHGVDSAVVIYGFIIFLVLTSPISANRNFPYHVRTNQISEINFPQNIYEVQYSANPQSQTAEGQNSVVSNGNANGLYRH